MAVLGQGPVIRVGVPAPCVLGGREAHDHGAGHRPVALDDLGLQAAADQLAAVALEDWVEPGEVFSNSSVSWTSSWAIT